MATDPFTTSPISRIGSWQRKMLVGDFNGDGKLDLVLLQDPYLLHGIGMALWFLEGNGDGTFQAPKEIASFPGASGCYGGGVQGDVQLSDVNGDGKLDLAFCTQSQIGVMLGNGDGTFKLPTCYTADPTNLGLFAFAFGDINSDGRQDLIVSEYCQTGCPQLVLMLGNGDGTFQAPQTLPSGGAIGEIGITLGDFNSDGLLDIIFQNGAGMDVYLQQ
jgi:hypothetical protein